MILYTIATGSIATSEAPLPTDLDSASMDRPLVISTPICVLRRHDGGLLRR